MEGSHISEKEAYEHIHEIQKSYATRKDRVLDSLSGAMWIVEKMYAYSGHFILEFIQNAEDAKATKVKIILRPGSIEIFNNGAPFSRDDVEAICSVGRSRKDPKEYVGYLGVGFKAVFLLSTKPHIYSMPYRFKFDKDVWPDSRLIPWQITPIWLDEIPEEYKEWNVVFRIPVDKNGYEKVKNGLQNLTPTTLLFLHNITEIEINFEDKTKVFRKSVRGGISTLEVEEDGNKTSTNWVIFREVIKVPEDIRNDKFTKDWNRDLVDKRELTVAFRLNDDGDLMPTTGTIKFGVFSYIPLKEEEVGIPFLIHGDFLVAPGREMIQREAPWNLWMLDELAKLIINSVIESFKKHELWKFSYTNVLYSIVYHSPFDIHLAQPINSVIKDGNHLVDLRGNFIKASEAIKVSDHVLGLLPAEFLEKFTSKKILHSRTKPHPYLDVKLIGSIRDLHFVSLEQIKTSFGDKWREALREYLIALAKDWFEYAESTRKSSEYKWKYSNATYLIDEEDNLRYPRDICIPASVEVEQKIKTMFPGRFKFLHNILRDKLIIDFLEDIEIEEVTEEYVNKLAKKELLPKILDELKNPSTQDKRKVEIVKEIKEFWKEGIITAYELPEMGILIRTKTGKWIRPQEAYLSSKYEPESDIEKLIIKGLLDFEIEFVDPLFIQDKTFEEKDEWKKFLEYLNVGSEVMKRENRIVERIGILTALKYEKEVLGIWDASPLAESERGKGYDIRSRMPDGSPKYIEVKASKGQWWITLTKVEYRFILENAERMYLYVVTNALKDPELHVILGKSLREMILKMILEMGSDITLQTGDWKNIVQSTWRPLS
ncbi:MAG: DUF3883 domain-containing protein [Nitrososphaerales archaeon]